MGTLRKFFGLRPRYVLVRISLLGHHGLEVIGRYWRKRRAVQDMEELQAQEIFWDTGEIINLREL